MYVRHGRDRVQRGGMDLISLYQQYQDAPVNDTEEKELSELSEEEHQTNFYHKAFLQIAQCF